MIKAKDGSMHDAKTFAGVWTAHSTGTRRENSSYLSSVGNILTCALLARDEKG